MNKKSLWFTVKRLDIFGIPVSLTHKGKDTFSTSFGTFLTILFVTVVFSKGAWDLERVVNFEIEKLDT